MADSTTEEAELVVLGGGPGGYPAAFAAADMGMQVTLVDDGAEPGGVCLHRGCIPSKALLHVAKLINEAREAASWGISFGQPEIDIDRLRQWKSSIVAQLTGGVGKLCKARGVQLVRARGSFRDSNTLELKRPDDSTSLLKAPHVIIATGSSPVVPPIFDIGSDLVMDSTAALELPEIPKRLLVIGGGYIGLEMGTVYAALGSKVTVVEMTSGLLPGADRDLVLPLKRKLEESFEAIYLNTKVASLQATSNGIAAELEGDVPESTQQFDRVLVAVGRRPNSANIGLENTHVELTERGFIKVDPQRRTSDAAVFAVGDVAGEPMLAHKATREAKVAVETLAGEPAAFDNVAIPAVVFTDPELAWCGVTESEGKSVRFKRADGAIPVGCIRTSSNVGAHRRTYKANLRFRKWTPARCRRRRRRCRRAHRRRRPGGRDGGDCAGSRRIDPRTSDTFRNPHGGSGKFSGPRNAQLSKKALTFS